MSGGREVFREAARVVQLVVSARSGSVAVADRSGRAETWWDGRLRRMAVRSEPGSEAGSELGWAFGERDVLELPALRRALGEACHAAGLRGWSLRIVERTRLVTVEREGRTATDRTSHLVLRLSATVAATGSRLAEVGRQVAGLAEWDARWLTDLPGRLAATAATQQRARPWDGPAVLPVVFESGSGGTVIHEAVGHLLEADAPARRVGDRVGPTAVTVLDDATLPGLWGSRRIDDEGRRCRPIILVDRGRVVALLHSQATEPTASASARRADYAAVPLPRMSNTYLAPGTDRHCDLLAGPAVLRCLRGGPAEVRAGSGEVLVRIRHAALLSNGEPVSEHRNLVLSLPAGGLLDRIEGIGGDLCFEPARCDRESQRVPVAHGAPAFRVPGVRVVA